MKSLALPLALLLACRPDLPSPGEGGADAAEAISFALEPEAPVEAAPHVARIRISGDEVSSLDPSEVVLARGELTKNNLEDLALGFPSEALTERILATTTYVDGASIVAIPHEAFSPGERYSLGIGRLGISFEFRAGATSAPILWRRWPIRPAVPVLFYCGESALPPTSEMLTLDPGGVEGAVWRGSPRGYAASCIRFDPVKAPVEGRLHPPLLVAENALDPSPIEVADARPRIMTTCLPDEVRFGPGCARVEDDRALVRGPVTETLWVVAHAGGEVVAVTDGDERFQIDGLDPSSWTDLSVETLSVDGVWRAEDVTVKTSDPIGRPVLNEVYANAIGSEPDQEWVEIVNDGAAPLLLDGLALEDVGGVSVLPSGAGTLSPGELALLVPATFDDSGQYDVAPAPGTLVVRVEKLGKNGLSNDGEPLRLLDEKGAVRSTFPSKPKPKAGVSVARTKPGALDEDPASFFLSDPATPGQTNEALE